MTPLEKAAKELIDALSFDDSGALIGGTWRGGNGAGDARVRDDGAEAVI